MVDIESKLSFDLENNIINEMMILNSSLDSNLWSEIFNNVHINIYPFVDFDMEEIINDNI